MNPARASETKQKKTPEGKQFEKKKPHGTKQKETPTTTSTETTVVTKSIKLEGSGSHGCVRTADFNELAQSIIEETISIYRAQIGGVDPFPERTEDFTLPHRFLVIPPGIYLAGSPAKFLSISTWIPPGFLMDSSPFHITLHSIFHLSMDSTWTPPGLQQS